MREQDLAAFVRRLLEREVARLLSGAVGLQELAPPLADLYNLGYFDGRASLAPALQQAEAAADRYYRIAFDPGSRRIPVAGIAYAELCRLRGEETRAEVAEATLASRLRGSVEDV